MDAAQIISRLQAQLTSQGLKAIGGAAELDTAVEGAVAVPAVYVMPLAESAKESSLVQVVMQRITQEFGVLTVVANRRDHTGEAALAELAPLRLALKGALVGWVPESANGEAMQFAGGSLMRFEEGRVWWVDRFSVVSYYRSA